MNNTIRKYGFFASTTICILSLLSWFVGKDLDFTTQEVIGYASMIVSLSFVFFGIKHFRDTYNNGTITFGKAFLIGVLISLSAAITFGLLDVVYVKFINPDFLSEYYDASLAQMKEDLSPEAFELKLADLESQKELFSNIWVNFLVMSMTVFVIGGILSVLSAMILKRKVWKGVKNIIPSFSTPLHMNKIH